MTSTTSKFAPPPADATHFQVSATTGEVWYWSKKPWYYSDSELQWVHAWHSWDKHVRSWVYESGARFVNPLIPIEEMWAVIESALPKFIEHPGTPITVPAPEDRFPVSISVVPLLVQGLIGQRSDGVVGIAVDSEQPRFERAISFWHEAMHFFRLAARQPDHDEDEIEDEARRLAMCMPDILERLGLEAIDAGARTSNAPDRVDSDLVRKAIAAVPKMD